jgi:surfeit locus 1 family protein
VKPRSLIILILVLGFAALFVRLGFWQISRWHQKQAMNVALRAALEQPPLMLGEHPIPLESARARRVQARGRFDLRRQIVLTARTHEGAPGVEIVTPLLIHGGSVGVLVDRGWLYAADAATAHPEEWPEPGERIVTGIAEPLRRGAGKYPLRVIRSDSASIYAARWLDLDSLSRRLPYAIAPYALRELPGPDVPEKPLRAAPRPLDETMHLSYAIQWFLFATILLVGSAALARTRRGGGRAARPQEDPLLREDL